MKRLLGFFALSSMLLISFQNCSQGQFDSIAVGRDYYHSGEGDRSCDTSNCHDVWEKNRRNKYLSQLGSIDYVASVLRDVFISPTSSESEKNRVEAILQERLLGHRNFFGGRCTHYDGEQLCTTRPGSTESKYNERERLSLAGLTPRGEMNTSREAVRMQVCDSLLADAQAFASVMGHLSEGVQSEWTADNAFILLQRFYPELYDIEVADRLLSELASYENLELEARWKKLVNILCYSPHWQFY